MYRIDEDKARSSLPDAQKKDFDDIVFQKVLGASTHIRLIGIMIESIVLDSIEKAEPISMMIERIEIITNFFIQTRGEASQAITNAIYQMTKGLHTYTEEVRIEEISDRIISVKNAYGEASKAANKQAVSYAIEIGNRMETILVYDYSSNVEAFIRGLQGDKIIYIAESRVINGGFPFVKPCLEAGHHIHFIPDASLMYYMKKCDGVFMGAETIYPDGTAFNTTGSDIVALLCQHYKIPLYFITPLIKLDIRPVHGKEKKLVMNDLKTKMSSVANPADLQGDINYQTPELLGVEPAYIKGFITEKGVIPSMQMYALSLDYIKELRGDDDV